MSWFDLSVLPDRGGRLPIIAGTAEHSGGGVLNPPQTITDCKDWEDNRILDLAADVSFAQGITQEQVSDEAIRLALRRLGVRWQRAKHWITSPDPDYLRKKGDATG